MATSVTASVLAELELLLGKNGVLSRPGDLKLYEYDGGVDKAAPVLVAFPQTTEHVIEPVKLAARHRILRSWAAGPERV